MSEIKDYTRLSLEELLIEQKKIKKQQLYSAVMIGVFIGVLVYGFIKNGFGWVYVSISVFMIYVINKNSKNIKQSLEQIGKEIAIKNAS